MVNTVLLQIQKQYERIPSFQCREGCTDCCGPVPFTVVELSQIEARPFTGLRCQYASSHGCTIYKHRPLMCRLFGTVDTPQLRCWHGKRPDVMLSAIQGSTIMRHYLKHPMGQDPLQDQSWMK
ncbi:MAG: hypothetical protein OEY86_07055 [Nitrospira sp.]|nr:hypothetical protein [Nitrospira sp.]